MSVLEDALGLHQCGRHAEAERLYCAVLAAAPAEPTALYLSGMLNVTIGRTWVATERLSALVAVQPDHVESWLSLARLHVLTGDGTAAIAAFRRVVALQPGHREAQRGLAEALLAAGRGEEAIGPARRAEAPGLLAWALLADGQVEAAVMASNGIDAGDPGGALIRAACLKAAWRLDEAADILRRAVAAAPGRASVLINLGTLCAELASFEEAERHLRAALAIDPGAAEAHASLGSVLLLTGRPDPAEAEFRAALDIAPDLVAAHRNLAAILAARRNHAAARLHRDAAYSRQNLFVEAAAPDAPAVLLLSTAGGGNVPDHHLFPRGKFSRLIWVVGYATPGQALPPFDLVFNAIGDADAVAGTEAPVADFLAGTTCPVLNPPARIAATARHRLPALLAGIDGVVVPAVRRLPPGSRLADAALAPPLLVRPAGTHGGQDTLLIEAGSADWPQLRADGPEDCYLTAFHDFRSPDGFFRKFRMIFVDRAPYPYHLAIGPGWLVHYETAGMDTDPAHRAEEQAFLANPDAALGPGAMAALRRIGQRLDLDFAGIDFALTRAAEILVFEANATMLVHPERDDGPFAYKNPAITRILDGFAALVAGKLSPGFEKID